MTNATRGIVIAFLLFPTGAVAAPRNRPPDLIVAGSKRLSWVAFRGPRLVRRRAFDLKRWAAPHAFGRHRILTASQGRLLTHTSRAVLLLDRRWRKPRVFTPKPGHTVGAIALYGDKVLVAAEGALLILDRQLTVLARVPLGVRGGRTRTVKNAHDIIVHGRTAFLMDNFRVPAYLLRADLSDVRNPKIVSKLKLEGVNLHLQNHWVVPPARRWGVIQSQRVYTGRYQKAAVVSWDGRSVLSSRPLFSHDFRHRSGPTAKTWILDMVRRPPLWALTLTHPDRYGISRVALSADRVTVHTAVDLHTGQARYYEGRIARHASWLAAHAAQKIWVVSTARPNSPVVFGKYAWKDPVLGMAFFAR